MALMPSTCAFISRSILPDIFMLYDRNAVGVLHPERSSLDALRGELGCEIVCRGRLGVGIVTGGDPGFIHHVKHHGQALGMAFFVRRGAEADSAAFVVIAEIEERRSLGMESHLVLQACCLDIIGFAKSRVRR